VIDPAGGFAGDLPDVTDLVRALGARGWTVATAESLTGGLLAAVLTEVPGASAVLRGGIVCYATDLKTSLAGVDAELLRVAGPVDPRVACQLAAGARQRCGADIGIGLTGVAGPEPQGGRPPGTVFVARSGSGGELWRELPPSRGLASRSEIRMAAVRLGLAMLADAVR
jgi:nicotinamide-nucleotide amidase